MVPEANPGVSVPALIVKLLRVASLEGITALAKPIFSPVPANIEVRLPPLRKLVKAAEGLADMPVYHRFILLAVAITEGNATPPLSQALPEPLPKTGFAPSWVQVVPSGEVA